MTTLPPPPSGRSGWPRTEDEESTAFSDLHVSWPRITVVTPSYNQGAYLEETIRSVLSQGYPNLEYMVIDGGSTDSSVEIIRRYESWLSYWVSEPDRGQSDAINKGFAKATGDIHGYLNSDDVYRPNALARVAAGFLENPTGLHAYPVVDVDDEGGVDMQPNPHRRRQPLTSAPTSGHSDPAPEGRAPRVSLVPLIIGEVYFHQPGIFWPASSYSEVGGFDEGYSFVFDHKFFLELMLAGLPLICHGGEPVACFRFHHNSKTVTSKRQGTNPFSLELWRVARELEPRLKKDEREVVRRRRIAMALSRVWRELRSGSGRRRALRVLFRALADHPDMLSERFFWSTIVGLGKGGTGVDARSAGR